MLALMCMAAFIAFQQAAVSPATWLLMSEIVPSEVRGLGMGIAGLALWVSNWVVAQFFLPVVEWLGGSLAFGIFAVLGLVAVGGIPAHSFRKRRGRASRMLPNSFAPATPNTECFGNDARVR